MSVWAWHLGCVRAAALVGPALLVGWRGSLRLSGLTRLLGTAVVALAFGTVAALIAGVAGLFALGPLVLIQLVLAVPLLGLSLGHEEAPGILPEEGWRAPLAAALPALAISLVRGLLSPPLNWDSLAYHLPFAVHWIQTGSLLTHVPLPAYPAQVTYFPAGGELPFAWSLLPWHGDAVLGAMNHLFLALASAAVAALALHARARPVAAAAAGALFALQPIQAASLLGTANVDLYLTFAFVACIVFLAHEDGAHAWLAALAAGLMLGIKLTALILIPVAGALGLAAGWRPGIRRLLLGLSAIGLVGGFWYARNAWVTGWPVYPLGAAALQSAETWASDPGRAGGARALADAILSMFGVAAPAGALALVVQLITGSGRLDRPLALATAGLLALWVITPNSGSFVSYNLRYALPGMALAAVSLAVALSRTDLSDEALANTGVALAGASLLATAVHLTLPPRWTLTALACLLLCALIYRARGLRLVLCIALLDLFAFQLFVEHQAPRTRHDWFYASYQGGMMRASAAWADTLPGATIALAGNLPPYPLYGARLQNRVTFVSVEPFGARFPHQVPGAVLRAHPDRGAWFQELVESHAQYLVVGRVDVTESFPPEDGWAARAPGAFALIHAEPHLRIYQVVSK